MSLPKEPRQLMINLMYLVLTAMLALNVSNEILHAFKVINESISKSNSSIEQKNNDLYTAISDAEKMTGKYDKVHPYKVKADAVKKEADDMYKYLENWKERIVAESGGRDEKGEVKREDNIDATTLLLVERSGGDTIKNKIEALRKMMVGQVAAANQKVIETQLPLKIEQPKKSDNNPQADWKVGLFHNMPTMAALTLFAKFQNDVRNSEALIINQIYQEAYSKDLKFDEIQAIAVPKTSYALVGQKVEAQIMLAAYNKAVNPQVTSSGGRVSKVENGVAYWETAASGVGLQTVRGSVALNMGDHMESRPYEFQYMVGSTGASMQLDKMNVFYIGVENPITVSAAGYSLEDISVNIPGGTVTPGAAKGQYNVTVTQPGEIMASINAKTPTGPKQVGTMKVRVKMIPDPVAEISGKSSGALSAAVFRVQMGPVAAMKAFEFETRFQITSFALSIVPKRGEMIGPFAVNNPKGSRFSDNAEIGKAMARLKPGDRVFIEEIKAVGPDRRTRALTPIILLLN